ncbi:hypothetical protein PTTG_27051 [Puccinia triticina 1-1 BBBD Race 1]|uniref:Uncharacterized protein n=1 Tax=Puccinia triticina (isolate 1-1 / race 1 (BBBD)) TaxID=630390 RepID=A0A180GNS4_PUCT1|nr:hypothetical protein PTTG_27051 [Puccinia triticina 1-1 BBBD Race 1]
MLRDPCFSHLTCLTVEQSISRLLTSVTDVQESIQTLASESLPERFDTLERTWAQIEGIISRFKHPPGIPHSTGESTHTRSPNDISTVPRAHSLVFFSQELNSTIFEAATSVISKFLDVLGGLSPLEMDLIRSAPTTGAGTYKDKLAKLTTLETELISHVILTMGPTQLLNVDSAYFQERVERALQSHGPYCDLQLDLMNMRAAKLRSQAVLEIVNKNQRLQSTRLATAHNADNLTPAESAPAPEVHNILEVSPESMLTPPTSLSPPREHKPCRSCSLPVKWPATTPPSNKRSAPSNNRETNKRTKL